MRKSFHKGRKVLNTSTVWQTLEVSSDVGCNQGTVVIKNLCTGITPTKIFWNSYSKINKYQDTWFQRNVRRSVVFWQVKFIEKRLKERPPNFTKARQFITKNEVWQKFMWNFNFQNVIHLFINLYDFLFKIVLIGRNALILRFI